MFKLDGNDTSTVLLETGRGWFILSATDDTTCPGFVVDYKSVRKAHEFIRGMDSTFYFDLLCIFLLILYTVGIII